MRTTVYAVIMASFVALLVAFATAPTIAAGPVSNPTMGQSGMTGEHQGQSGKSDTEFSGEAKSGASQEGKTGAETKPAMKDEGKGGFFGEMKERLKGVTRGEAEKKPEARTPGAGMTGTPEHGTAGMMERGTAGGPERGTPGMMERGAAERGRPAGSKGGEAVVLRVDQPDNCLRVRSEPSTSANQIACIAAGDRVRLTGVFSPDGRWAQLDNNGWVFFSQLQTDVSPPESMDRSWKQPAGAGDGGKGKGAHRGGSYCYYGGGYGGYYYPSYFSGLHYSYPRHYGVGFFGFPGL